MMGDYAHPASGRVYRKGDPAHDYALALNGARCAAEAVLAASAALVDLDYLAAFTARDDRTAARLRDALDWLSHTDHGVRLDMHRREQPDDDWQRRYGPLSE